MSDNDIEDDQNWGDQKRQYYAMNKRDNEDDSDYIEYEKEAIKLQNKKLERIKKANLLNKDEIEEEEEDERDNNKHEVDKIKNNNTQNNNQNFNKDDIFDEIKLCKSNINDAINELNDIIEILNDKNNKFFNNIPSAKEYLQSKKNLLLGYSACLLFSSLLKMDNKMSNHHPVIKKLETFKYLLEKNDEEIQNKIDQLLELFHNSLAGNNNSKEEGSIENEENDNEDNDEDIEIEDNDEEDIENEDNENEDNENEDIENEHNDENIDKEINLLSRKTKRNMVEKDDEEIIEEENKNQVGKEEDEENMDNNDFIKSQIKNYNNIKKKQKENIIKNKEKIKKEINRKNELAIQKANKEVLKARGIYRKRKQYQGNAKLMNREKYAKKQKLRKKMVKEYEGKPDVYMGESTGIRRDLIRSTNIKS